MNIKKIIVILIITIFVLSSCGKNELLNENITTIPLTKKSNQIIEIKSIEQASVSKTDDTKLINSEEFAIGGTYDRECVKHSFTYHNIILDFHKIEGFEASLKKINDDVEIMSKSKMTRDEICIESNIYQLIKKYNISRETFESVIGLKYDSKNEIFIPGYNKEEIDVLYSDDMTKINEMFLNSSYSIYHDGEIYDVYWLASHTSEDYMEKGLPVEKIDKLSDILSTNSNFDKHTDIIKKNEVSYKMQIEKEASASVTTAATK